MYRSESTSSSFSSVNGKSRGEMKQSLEEDGLRLRRHIRTKDGKVTKAKERLSKSAAAPMTHALGGLAGSALGAGAGYFSSKDPEKRKKRALIGGGIGAVGGGLAPFLMRRGADSAPGPVGRAAASAPDELFDPAPDLPFQSAARSTTTSSYEAPPKEFRKYMEDQFEDNLRKYRGYEAGLEGYKRELPHNEVADAIRRMGGTPDVVAAPVFRPFKDGYTVRDGQLADVAASIARRPEYADVLANMEDVGAKPGDFLSDLARDIARRDVQAAFGKTASALSGAARSSIAEGLTGGILGGTAGYLSEKKDPETGKRSPRLRTLGGAVSGTAAGLVGGDALRYRKAAGSLRGYRPMYLLPMHRRKPSEFRERLNSMGAEAFRPFVGNNLADDKVRMRKFLQDTLFDEELDRIASDDQTGLMGRLGRRVDKGDITEEQYDALGTAAAKATVSSMGDYMDKFRPFGIGTKSLKKRLREIEKNSSTLSPEALHFFRDELEKQAISPGFSDKFFDAPGIKGGVARLYAKTFSPGGLFNPERVMRLNDVAQQMNSPAALAYGSAFGKATLLGTAKKEGLHALRVNPRFADAITKIERDVPTHLFPASYGNAVENLGIIGKALGL